MRLGLVHTYAEQLEGTYVPWQPAPFPEPALVWLNRPLLDELGLDPSAVEPHAAGLFSGSALPEDARPLAQAYAGHQFGGFSPQLGDGRALLLGELEDRRGIRRDLHLKGSGPTPFSRGGDGRAVLGPVLREVLLGEAMHHLGIPTTRALAAVRTGESVMRTQELPGAVLARVAASHLRVGTLQFFAARQDHARLARIVDYALERHHPDAPREDNPANALLQSVAEAQARLIARWMLVGFVHGVMNTDNTTLSGETIDYGPCAFLDAYDPAAVFSSIDHAGRYAYGRQPAIGGWNLARMGEALLPLLAPDESEAIALAEAAIGRYAETYQRELASGMRAKLGLLGEDEQDLALISDLLAWMHQTGQDYTATFRRLADTLSDGTLPFLDSAFLGWRTRWLARLGAEDRARIAARMNQHNPLYVPRNHLVEAALDAAIEGDLAPFCTLLEVLSAPYQPQPGREPYERPAPPEFGPYRTFCGT